MTSKFKVAPTDLQSIRNRTISNKPGKTPYRFNWALDHLEKWMWFVGVAPQRVGKRCTLLNDFVCGVRFLVVIVILSSLVLHSVFNARSVTETYVNDISNTLSWNFIIDNLTYATYVIGVNGFLIYLTRSKTWAKLVSSFTTLEETLSPTFNIYKKCRKFSIYVILYTITTTLFQTLTMVLVMIIFGGPLERKALDATSFLLRIIPCTALALFCTLVRLSSFHVSSIRLRIAELQSSCNSPLNVMTVNIQRTQLHVLKWQHLLLSKTISELNGFFGFFLVFEVCYIFVGVINSSLFLLMNTLHNDWLLAVFSGSSLLDHVVRLFVLTSSTDDIVIQVNLIHQALAELLHFRPVLQNEINMFNDQLVLTKSRIDAMGYFDVSKKLFPALIGTTLTYFLVLLQFYSSEKE